MFKIVNKEKYEGQQKELSRLKTFAFDIYSMNGVLTGKTVSYEGMRRLVRDICDKVQETYPDEVREGLEIADRVDKIAFHSSILKDACVNGYDGLFKDVLFD